MPPRESAADNAPTPKAERRWPARLWDAETGELARTFTAHRAEITAVAFSPDDQFVFTGDSNGRGRLWN